jgi:hypothetical protein
MSETRKNNASGFYVLLFIYILLFILEIIWNIKSSQKSVENIFLSILSFFGHLYLMAFTIIYFSIFIVIHMLLVRVYERSKDMILWGILIVLWFLIFLLIEFYSFLFKFIINEGIH